MYRQRFDSEAFVSTAYRKRIEALVKAVCTKYKLGRRRTDALLTREAVGGAQPVEWPRSMSGSLAFTGSSYRAESDGDRSAKANN
jgi:hypothetical protein